MEPTVPAHAPCPVPTLAAPPRRPSAGSARPGRCPEGARAVGTPRLGDVPRGAPSATGCPACHALCSPQTPASPQGQVKLPSVPPLPTQTPSRDRQSHQQCPCALQNPSTPSPTRAALFRSEYPQYQPARGGGDIVSQAGGPGPCCRDKGGRRNPRWGAPGGSPYPRRPAGCAPSPRSAAGGDAPWCVRSSTRLWEEGLGVGIPAWSPSPAPRSCAPATPHGLGAPHSTPSVRPPSCPTPHRRATAQHAHGRAQQKPPALFWHSGVPLPATHTLVSPAPGRQAPAEHLRRAGGPGSLGDSGAGGRGGGRWGQELSRGQPLPARLRCGCPCRCFWPQGQLWGRQPWFGSQTGGQSLHPGIPASTTLSQLRPAAAQLSLRCCSGPCSSSALAPALQKVQGKGAGNGPTRNGKKHRAARPSRSRGCCRE